jgi:uncharacterized protein
LRAASDKADAEDPQSFLAGLDNRIVVLDEIHRLPHPSEVLKIVADHFPAMKVLPTGSSTLGASAKFRGTLAGRKAELRLTPMIFVELEDFQNTDLGHRFLFGGLPPFFLVREIPERDFQQRLILRPGNKQCSKNLKGVGQFSIITVGQF